MKLYEGPRACGHPYHNHHLDMTIALHGAGVKKRDLHYVTQGSDTFSFFRRKECVEHLYLT